MRAIVAMGILLMGAGCMTHEPSSTTYRIWLDEPKGGTDLSICVGNDAWCQQQGMASDYHADPDRKVIRVRSTGRKDAEGRWEPMMEALGQAMWETPGMGMTEEAGM